MLRKGIILGDTHWVAGAPFHWSYRLAKKIIQAAQPDFIVHIGDSLELSYLSSFNSGKQ